MVQCSCMCWNHKHYNSECGSRGVLMVSALDSGSGGPGSCPGRGTALCSWARYFTLIVPLSTQVYKWVPANLVHKMAFHNGSDCFTSKIKVRLTKHNFFLRISKKSGVDLECTTFACILVICWANRLTKLGYT